MQACGMMHELMQACVHCRHWQFHSVRLLYVIVRRIDASMLLIEEH
jgi:hypothetical protein